MHITNSHFVLTVLKCFQVEFSFKANMPNPGYLLVVMSAPYRPWPATLISIYLA